MITIPTTFVLGAGASQPYGFPTGIGLRKIILENFIPNPNTQWIEALNLQNVDKAVALRFASQFSRSGTLSIDSFLSSHSDLVTVGKICIALALIPFEEEDKLFEPALAGSVGWYEHLLKNIVSSNDMVQPGIITIITFNYDRSLDHFIYKAIMNTFSDQLEKQEVKIENLLDRIQIHHIHGQLGDLSWQGNHSRAYSPNLSEGSLEIAWKRIRVPSEQYENKTADTIVGYNLNQSERIYFLGFGYDDDNLEKLGISSLKGKTIIGTSYNLTDLERRKITSNWGIELPQDNCMILEFLRRHAPLD